jgi:hypothetical protein
MHRTAKWRVTALSAVGAMAMAVAACGGPTSSATSTTTSSVPSTSTTTPSTTHPSTSTTLFGSTNIKGTTVFSQEAAGTLKTRSFTVPTGAKQWDLAWSYDCPGAAPHSVVPLQNFVVVVYKGRAKDTKDTGTQGALASGTGTEHYTDSGTFSLQVGAQPSCSWSLKAIIPSS